MEIFILIIVLIILFIIVKFNTFTRLKNRMKNSKSSIDVYLTQRFDLIPNLVQCVKEYAKYEQETLQKITELRNVYSSTKSLDVAQNLNSQMNNVIAVAEENVDLKASEQFQILQKNLIKMESQLQAARRVYNGDVTLYNTTIQTFPNNIIASLFNMQPEQLLEIEEYKTKNLEVKI